MPVFTIGIPTYNRAYCLPYTLSCLLQQTFQDFEVLILTMPRRTTRRRL